MKHIDTLIKDYQNYLFVEKGLSALTIEAYLNDINLFHTRLNITTSADYVEFQINDFINLEAQDGHSPSTIRRRLSSVYNYFLFLKEQGVYTNNLPKVVQPQLPRRLPTYLTVEEVEKLLEMPDLTKATGIRDKAMLELMYASGLRVSELLTLKRDQVNINRGLIRVFGKGSKERIVPFGDFALSYLVRYINEVRAFNVGHKSNTLFLNNAGEPLSRQYFHRIVKQYAQAATITKQVSPHSLRHAFATHLIENECELRIVQALLGHVNIATTQIYTHVSAKRILSIYDEATN